jgi:hypothetical protein
VIISRVAITHGGIGTIPVFANAGVQQIFVPHDLDQAINSILASRSGAGKTISLGYQSIILISFVAGLVAPAIVRAIQRKSDQFADAGFGRQQKKP